MGGLLVDWRQERKQRGVRQRKMAEKRKGWWIGWPIIVCRINGDDKKERQRPGSVRRYLTTYLQYCTSNCSRGRRELGKKKKAGGTNREGPAMELPGPDQSGYDSVRVWWGTAVRSLQRGRTEQKEGEKGEGRRGEVKKKGTAFRVYPWRTWSNIWPCQLPLSAGPIQSIVQASPSLLRMTEEPNNQMQGLNGASNAKLSCTGILRTLDSLRRHSAQSRQDVTVFLSNVKQIETSNLHFCSQQVSPAG